MVLLDSTVWIDHLRSPKPAVIGMLRARAVLMHTAIIGEVLLGRLKNRAAVANAFAEIPMIKGATDKDVLTLIEQRRLYGSGIGWVDAHLVAACLLDGRAYLWSQDQRLLAVAARLGIDATTA